MSAVHLGIAGAGLLGRLLAWSLSRRGFRVSVFDPAGGPEPHFDGHGAAAHSAAGLLSPSASCDGSGPLLADHGWRSLQLWREIVELLPDAPAFALRGSLLLAPRGTAGAARRQLGRVPEVPGDPRAPLGLDAAALAALEPALHSAGAAWLLPGEGQIDTVQAMRSLYADAPAVLWCWACQVTDTAPGALCLEGARTGWRRFDTVFDVRGLGARRELGLRGVRGDTVWLHAPGHGLTRPVQLLKPRRRVCLVPRPGDVIVVAGSEQESEDRSEVALASAVALMTAARGVLPALGRARILRLDRNLRPALADNRPLIEVEPGRVRINGLFRHGWLLAPALIEQAMAAWMHCDAEAQRALH